MVDKKMYMATKIPDDPRGKQNHILNKMIKNLGNTTWTLLFEEQGELIQAISKLKRFGKINKKTNYDNGFDAMITGLMYWKK